MKRRELLTRSLAIGSAPWLVPLAAHAAEPENWQALRAQWEYSHAANALVMFASFCLVTLSALTTRH